jgi:chromosome segregation ATPase
LKDVTFKVFTATKDLTAVQEKVVEATKVHADLVKLKDQIYVLENTKLGIEKKIEELIESADIVSNDIKILTPVKDDLIAKQAELDSIKAIISKAKTDYNVVLFNIVEKQDELAKAVEAKEKAESDAQVSLENSKALTLKIDELNETIAKQEKEIAHRAEQNAIGVKIFSDLTQKVNDLHTQITAQKETILAQRHQINQQTEEIAGNKDSLEAKKNEIITLRKDLINLILANKQIKLNEQLKEFVREEIR